MEFKTTFIEGLFVAETNKIGDERGNFMRLFCKDDLQFPHNIKQINHSFSQEKGTIRGMHFQKAPALESKIVRCLRGAIYDVAVDLRESSETFLQHFAIELNQDNNLALIIPEGCAHGFQTLQDDCAMIYLHSETYQPEHESGLRFDDPKLNIKWPLDAKNQSERDLSFQLITNEFKGIKNAV